MLAAASGEALCQVRQGAVLQSSLEVASVKPFWQGLHPGKVDMVPGEPEPKGGYLSV